MSQILSDLNASNIEEISSSKNEPVWLSKYRKHSLSIYDELPVETSPLYTKYTDAQKMDMQQVSLAYKTAGSIPVFLQKRIGELENQISIVQIGTNIHKVNVPEELRSKGLTVSSSGTLTL